MHWRTQKAVGLQHLKFLSRRNRLREFSCLHGWWSGGFTFGCVSQGLLKQLVHLQLPGLVFGEQWFEAGQSPDDNTTSSDDSAYRERLSFEPVSDLDIESLLEGGGVPSPFQGSPVNDISMASAVSGGDTPPHHYHNAQPSSPSLSDSCSPPPCNSEFDFTTFDLESILAL